MKNELMLNGFQELDQKELMAVNGGVTAGWFAAIAAGAVAAYELGKAVGKLFFRFVIQGIFG